MLMDRFTVAAVLQAKLRILEKEVPDGMLQGFITLLALIRIGMAFILQFHKQYSI